MYPIIRATILAMLASSKWKAVPPPPPPGGIYLRVWLS